MSTYSAYSQKLKDPRWQKKRLKILERDNWTCQDCKSTEQTLHVHHCYYMNGKDPWDYPDDSLITVCYECHENIGLIKDYIKYRIDYFFKDPDHLRELDDFFEWICEMDRVKLLQVKDFAKQLYKNPISTNERHMDKGE